jgi:hypothetical protein
MDDEAHRLKTLIESTTKSLKELRRLNDPATTALIQDIEQARAEAVAQLAAIGGRFAATEGRPHALPANCVVVRAERCTSLR